MATASPSTPISSATTSEPPWTTEVDADTHPWSLGLGELWRYRDLAYLMARRDIVTIYKQTILGPLWFLIQPVLTTALFVVIFTRVAQLPTDGVPPLLFYLSGTVLWTFFAEGLKTTADSFVQNAELFQKVYFPRVIAPLAKLSAAAAKFGIQFALFGAFVAYFVLAEAFRPNLAWWSLLALPAIAVTTACFSLGLGLLLSSLTYKYRDLTYLVQFAIQLGLYATPVVYPLSAAPEEIADYLALNPMASLVEAFRLASLGSGTVSAGWLAYSALASVATLLIGALLYQRAERTFADTV